MNTHYAFVQENFVPEAQASLLIGDLSIQRGYGIFDFFKTLDHRPVFLDEHLDRFFHSAEQLRLPLGRTRAALRAIISQLQQKNQLPDSGIRLTLTGGYSQDGYTLATPNLVITQHPLPAPITEEPQKSIQLVSWPHQRQLPDTKSIDYLMAIWLQPHIREKEADDVLYHQDGIISECPRSNFFVVTADDTLVTPDRNVLKGIIRMKVLDLARRGLRVEERELRLEELKTAKEAFITSTTKHILPVIRLDGEVIGAGIPGPIARLLSQQLYRMVRERVG